jgi:acyl-CoA thioesterase
MERHLFERDGERFVPSALCRGPWYPDTQHGSPMLGLLARAIEEVPSQQPVQVVRFTADLMRAAPLAPVQTRARLHRAGKHVEYVEASLLAGEAECARATAMRIRVGEVAVPESLDGASASVPDFPADDGGLSWIQAPDHEGPALHHAFELRPVPGFATPTAWLRFRAELVRGEAPSPLVRVALAADFTYPIAVIRAIRRDRDYLVRQPFVAINPDTTVNLHRPMRGEWLCIDTQTHLDRRGTATASARLYDREGAIGFASQSLLVRGPEAAPANWRRQRG